MSSPEKLAVVHPAQLEYPLEAPQPGSVSAVAEGIYWLRMPLPFALEHINLWLLADRSGWTLVDCGYATSRVRALWEQVFERALAGRPVARIIVTHCHPDHIGLAAWLGERFGLQPWMTELEYLLAHAAYHRTGGTSLGDLQALYSRHGLEPARFAGISSPEDHYRRGVPQVPQAFNRLRDGEAIEIGGNAWRVIVGRGHSPEHASLYCQDLNVLISGDMVLPRVSTNVSVWPMEPEADPLKQYLSSLERLGELPPTTLVLPSHGLPFRGLQRRIAGLEAHHADRLERALEVCREPRTAAELLPRLFGRDFKDYQLLFAMGETIAHLNHLMHAARLERSADGSGSYRFRRIPSPGRRHSQ